MIVFAVLAHRTGKIVTAVGYNRQVFVCGFHEIYLRISVFGYTVFTSRRLKWWVFLIESEWFTL